MNNRVNARLAALAEAVRRRQMERALPVDGLSRSLMNFADELAALDNQGKVALLEQLNRPDEDGPGLGLTPEDLARMIECENVKGW